MTRRALAVAAALLCAPQAAAAHEVRTAAAAQQVQAAAAPSECPGDPIVPTRVVTGELSEEHQGSYVLVPFDVPVGTTSVRVKYCYDQPEAPTSAQIKHTLDLGLYEARSSAGALWGEREFRGWGGSSHPDVTVTPEGFSSEEQYRTSPRGHVPGRTTRGFRPGPLTPGRWAAELGVAAVVDQSQGDADGRVAWRIEIELRSDPQFADDPYRPSDYDERPARDRRGWYAGDLHVHAEHSSLGDATMTETFDYAFSPPGPDGAGLDFITLSDYVTDSAWGEIGRHQAAHPGRLVVRSSEIITYRGHANNHASLKYVDYRTGAIYERADDGALVLRRGTRPPRELFDEIHEAGGWTQVNHPTIFPSEVPAFQVQCRGCPWDYTDDETRWESADAYEVHTGPAGLPQPQGNEPGPNPFTLTAIEEFDRLRRDGFGVTGVAVSDSHNAGRTPGGVTQSPIGEGTTVLYAPELSERGIRSAVLAGHAYVKLFGADSPDLRLEASADDRRAMMGDSLPGDEADFEARVVGGVSTSQRRQLLILRDGSVIDTVPVTSDDFTHRFRASRAGDYRIQVMRGSAVDALTNPISLGAAADERGTGGPGARRGPERLRLRVLPRRVRAGRRVRYRFRVTTRAGRPVSGARVHFAGRRTRTDARGRASVVRRLRARGRRRARASRPGLGRARATVRVLRRR